MLIDFGHRIVTQSKRDVLRVRHRLHMRYVDGLHLFDHSEDALELRQHFVGFALTLSTTYHHPFHCARVFNALDHVTRGRIAWNAVTSAYKNEAANYGFDVMMEHDERYERAQEFLQVACALFFVEVVGLAVFVLEV